MTALLEIKQNIKRFYGEYEVYILPVLKFALAFVYFLWINSNMGYMKQLDNIFVILVLALVCAILPVSVMMFIGFAMMIGHCYAVGPEVAGFMLVLILFMMILFLRFSGSQNLTLILTPLSFGFSVPTLLPLGAGLLGSAVSALPAGCGVVIYYFIRFVHAQSAALSDQGTEIAEKLKLLSDGLVQNWAMWITVIAFVVVVLLVNLLRTRVENCDHCRWCGLYSGYSCGRFLPGCDGINGSDDHIYSSFSSDRVCTGILCLWRRLQQDRTVGV